MKARIADYRERDRTWVMPQALVHRAEGRIAAENPAAAEKPIRKLERVTELVSTFPDMTERGQ